MSLFGRARVQVRLLHISSMTRSAAVKVLPRNASLSHTPLHRFPASSLRSREPGTNSIESREQNGGYDRSGSGNRQISVGVGLSAVAAATCAWLLQGDAAQASADARVGVDAASRYGGFRSSRYESLPDMIEEVFPALCKMVGQVDGRKLGGGSGFVISEDGLVVTNAHVFEAMAQAGAQELTACFDDGRVFAVEHIASDPEADIAVGRIVAPPGTKFRALRVGQSSAMRRGDLVAVLGAPLGGGLVPTVGVLSGIRYVADDELMNHVLRSRSDWCLLQCDANMSSGSSGGPIVNADGELVGVSVMVQTGAGPGTVGVICYGVASDQAWPVVKNLISKGSVDRAVIGMTIVTVDQLQNARETAETGTGLLPPPPSPSAAAEAASGGNGAYHTGLLVTFVVPGRPAEAAGLREGDVLLEINGRRMVRKGDYFASLGPVYDPSHVLRCTMYRPPPPGSKRGTQGKVFTALVKPEARGSGGNAQGAESAGYRQPRRRAWTYRG